MKVLISLEFHYWEGTTPIDGVTATPKLDQMLEEWKDVDSTALMSLWEVVLREIKEVTDEKIAQILDQARSMGYLHIDMAWEIGVLDPLVWLVYILHLNCLIHHYRRHFPAQRGSWTVGGVTWWHSAPDRLGLEDVFFLSGRLWLAWFKTLAWKRIWVIFGFELCPGSKGVEFDRLDSFGLIWDENFAMSLEAKNFCSTHSSHLIPCGFPIFYCILFQVPTRCSTSCRPPNQWSKSPSMSTTGACCSSVLLECYVDERSLATCYSTHGTEWQLPEPSVGKCEPSTVACRMQRVTGVALAGEWCQVGIFLTKDEIKDIKALDR